MQDVADTADAADAAITRPEIPPIIDDGPLRVRHVLTLPALVGTEVAAGERGLHRVVHSVNVTEVTDVVPWVKPQEFLVTTGFPHHHRGDGPAGSDAAASTMGRLVDGLAQRGVSALGVRAGRGREQLPHDVLAIADGHDLPVLVLPCDVAYNELLSEIFTQLVGRQAWALDVADRLHRSLTSLVLGGGDLPQIAAEVAGLFNAAALICTPDGRVQTIAGSQRERDAFGALPLCDDAGRVRTERLRPGAQPVSDRLGAQLAVAPIVAGGASHGMIIASASGGGLGAVAMQALERAATVAALVITKQLAVSAVESKFRGDFLRDVLNGDAGPRDIVEHSAQLGWNLARPVAVVVARIDDPSPASVDGRPLERLTAAWQQAVRVRDAAAPVVGFAHEVVALLPASPDTLGRLVTELVRTVSGSRADARQSFSMGVSRVVDSVADLPMAYEQAATALRVARRAHGQGSIAHFDDLGVQRLLSLVSDSDELRSFVADVLAGLDADSPDMLDLRTTLQELIDRNCNIAATARALHFHYNTLRYRIAKLESLIGPFTTDARLRLDVALALQILEMRGL